MATAYTDRVKAVEDQLAVSGPNSGLIFVLPDCTSQLGGCTYLSSPTIGDYESYIVREIVAQVDASYRTLATRDSRGAVGCSMGGDGAAHLALKYPQVFGAFASIAGTYDWTLDPNWEVGRQGFKAEPRSWDDLKRHGVEPLQVDMMAKWRIAEAAAASPNPDKPPFYLDMPFEIVEDQARIVPDVAAKIGLVDPLHDLAKYLQQPDRLRGMMLYHASNDPVVSVETSRRFDRTLTSYHIDHTYLEAEGGAHCDMDWTPVVQFMMDNLAR
jgi:pimeloyl-ACP methyl ester carboxylesterase